MTDRISEHQLEQLVAEVESLSNRRKQELDRDQVKEILQELNLPPDLLDEAMIQLKRREALTSQTKNNRLLLGGIAGVLIVAIAFGSFFLNARQKTYDSVSVYAGAVTLAEDQNNNITSVLRQSAPQLNYRVTLEKAPLGEKLSLRCDWIDPQGNIAHQNNYQTKTIESQTWTTQCRYQLKPTDLVGNWQVKMFLGDRLLSQGSFVVK